MLQVHRRGEPDYEQALQTLGRRGDTDLARVQDKVAAILADVESRGDIAVREYTQKFEDRQQSHILLPEPTWRQEGKKAPADVVEALREAASRIRAFHEHQAEPGFVYEDQGIVLGQRVRPVGSVAVYAPGGKARYPSTVLMTAVVAAVAGVKRIVLVTPRPTSEILAAAEIAGVTEVVDAGGAQAIAAVAYGTQSVTRVDKIVGPGNIYVACAKRLVFGLVDIDSIAGPSEILVIADEGANPQIVAADLLSQAEHDEAAYPLLAVPTDEMADAVDVALKEQLESLPRASIATEALSQNGNCFVTGDLREAARVANVLAPEHLSLSVKDADSLMETIDAAGAFFLGYHTPEAAGDYAAGPSHVLPTGGAARFASPLGVYDFVVRSSIVRYSADAIDRQGPLLQSLARLEGLEAHARAVKIREKS